MMSRNGANLVERIKKYAKDTRRDLNTTLTYVKLAMKGNKVERLTDFSRCQHPVLLLYGFGATRRVFSILERRLRKDGFGVFSFNLGGMFDTFNTRCIEEMAQLVHDKVERLCQRYDLKKISVIGHSKGGLIGRYYVKRLGGSHRVRTLITLGTPHGGNPWALVGIFSPLAIFSRSLWQMYPMSPFIRKLQKGAWPKHVRFVSIYSKEDRVCFYKSSILDIPEGVTYMKNVLVPGLSHSDYLIRKTAYNLIKRELATGEKQG
jgi:triacylglycerol esterase/lipase EstA (alpha/beta hydrolase family)